MWCCNCPFLANCEDPAQLGGGCDCDGADDYGVDPIDDGDADEEFCELPPWEIEPEPNQQGTMKDETRTERRS